MASTISFPTSYVLCSSTQKNKSTIPSSLLLNPQTSNYGLRLLSRWNGLKPLGLSSKQKCVKIERRARSKGMVVHASLFGVGAPEALVIGVVALLVFGPKGLAEVARNLGKTLRAFQPTIRELQDVSREFKNTLEREIGLDDIPPTRQNTTTTTTTSSSNSENSQTTLDQNVTPPNGAYSTEELLKRTEEQIALAVQQQTAPPEPSESQLQVQDGDSPPEKPFNLGELLVEAQMKSHTTQKQEESVAQEAQSELEARPEAAAPASSPPPKSESEK